VLPRHDGRRLTRLRRFAAPLGSTLHERVTRWNAFFFDDLDQLFRRDFLASIQPIDGLAHLALVAPEMEGRTALSQMLHANFASYLPDDLLVKLDRCSMAHALEARSPFLDIELVEYVASLPDAAKLRGWRTKVVLREAFADLIPAPIRRRRKMGFGVPLAAWFRGLWRAYLRDLLLDPAARYRTYLSAPFVETLVTRHLNGDGSFGPQLWSLLCFEQWLRLLPEWTSNAPAAELAFDAAVKNG
jgi:asparagine synthase (glutamine-hydrolysing)